MFYVVCVCIFVCMYVYVLCVFEPVIRPSCGLWVCFRCLYDVCIFVCMDVCVVYVGCCICRVLYM